MFYVCCIFKKNNPKRGPFTYTRPESGAQDPVGPRARYGGFAEVNLLSPSITRDFWHHFDGLQMENATISMCLGDFGGPALIFLGVEEC